jgi:hypothetical protein
MEELAMEARGLTRLLPRPRESRARRGRSDEPPAGSPDAEAVLLTDAYTMDRQGDRRVESLDERRRKAVGQKSDS